ncbi:MAG TPA: PfkB family carbohydrate kinase [Terriglobia bacterium]|nr:PfkB family carbohydrate kinase [Terriglobia bacterium]
MTTPEILAAFPKLAALVVGDICLDRWCTYDPTTSEPSRETGIPRLGVVSTEVTPGGGGTVANNLAALGTGRVAVLGVRGDDGFGFELERALAERGVTAESMVKVRGWQTFTYTKLLNRQTGIEDQPRADFISTRPLPPEAEQRVLDNLCSVISDYDMILVADQAETNAGGVVTAAVRNLIIELATTHPEKVFLVDSRKRIDLFRHVIIKPNRQEAEAACHKLFGVIDYQRLRGHVESKVMMVTHGPKGVLVVEEGKETWVPARAIENPVDICGAGDSFAAGAALTLAVTGDALAATRFGNLVASITIMKKGTGTASPEEVAARDER